MRALTVVFVLSLFIGCSRPATVPPILAPSLRTIKMGDATLFIVRDNWLYSFATAGRQCVIVGSNVAYIERKAAYVIVNTDLTQSEMTAGKTLGPYSLLNIPTNGLHPVLLADTGGFTQCSIEIPQQLEPVAFIQECLSGHP
jgi:hypothetical protein